LDAHSTAAAAVRSLPWPARISSMTAFGTRIVGVRRSIRSSRPTREKG
jgi:hypothetical protein